MSVINGPLQLSVSLTETKVYCFFFLSLFSLLFGGAGKRVNNMHNRLMMKKKEREKKLSNNLPLYRYAQIVQ